MDTKSDLQKNFEKLYAEALISPLPKLKSWRPNNKSQKVQSSSEIPSSSSSKGPWRPSPSNKTPKVQSSSDIPSSSSSKGPWRPSPSNKTAKVQSSSDILSSSSSKGPWRPSPSNKTAKVQSSADIPSSSSSKGPWRPSPSNKTPKVQSSSDILSSSSSKGPWRPSPSNKTPKVQSSSDILSSSSSKGPWRPSPSNKTAKVQSSADIPSSSSSKCPWRPRPSNKTPKVQSTADIPSSSSIPFFSKPNQKSFTIATDGVVGCKSDIAAIIANHKDKVQSGCKTGIVADRTASSRLETKTDDTNIGKHRNANEESCNKVPKANSPNHKGKLQSNTNADGNKLTSACQDGNEIQHPVDQDNLKAFSSSHVDGDLHDNDDDDFPLSGHVTDCHGDDQAEVSSYIDDEEEFFFHKPRPNRRMTQENKRPLNLDGLWARIVLHRVPGATVEVTHGPHPLPRFLSRNLRNGRHFFHQYIMTQMTTLTQDAKSSKTGSQSDKGTKEASRRGQKRKSISEEVKGEISKANKKTKQTECKSKRVKSGQLKLRTKGQTNYKSASYDRNKVSTKSLSNKKTELVPSKSVLSKKTSSSRTASRNKNQSSSKPNSSNRNQLSSKHTSSKINQGSSKSSNNQVASKPASSLTNQVSTKCVSKTASCSKGHQENTANDSDSETFFFDIEDDDFDSMSDRTRSKRKTRTNSSGKTDPKISAKGVMNNKPNRKMKPNRKKINKTKQSRNTDNIFQKSVNPKKIKSPVSKSITNSSMAFKVMPLSQVAGQRNMGASSDAASSLMTGEDDWGFGIKPVFSTIRGSGHCGAVWKTIVDESAK